MKCVLIRQTEMYNLVCRNEMSLIRERERENYDTINGVNVVIDEHIASEDCE